MGSGSQNTQGSTQQVNQVQLPPWINQAAQANYGLAQNIAMRPLQQYQGQQIADIGPQTQQAWNLAAQSGGAGADQYNAAQAGLLTAMGTPATQINPQTLASTSLSPYMSPYTSSVINSTLPLMQQQLGQQQIGNQSQAAGAGAYGGSRQAIQQGVTQAQGALGMGQMAANLNQANFGQAQAAATGDITRDLQAQQANQGANQANINSMIQAAGGMGTLGSQAQQNQRQQFLELATAGAQQQQQQQNQIQAQMGQFNQAWGYPGVGMGILQSALGMTPYGNTSIGSSTQQQQTTTDQGMGNLIFGGLQSLGGMFGMGGPFGAGGMFGAALPHGSGTAHVPGPMHLPPGMDVMPSMLAPGEAVLNREAAEKLGRPKIAALNQAGLQDRAQAMASTSAQPAIRPRRMPGANGAFTTRIPGPLAPTAPSGLSGALGANMRAQGMRRRGPRMPVAGALGGGLLGG